MTDKDIIKALECCIKPTSDCDNCPYYGYDDDLQCFDMSKRDALDLINRQQAEIERLQNIDLQIEVSDRIEKKIKAEVIKEFAERLKATPMRFSVEYVKYYDKPPIKKMVLFIDDNDINNLVKEMVGEGK